MKTLLIFISILLSFNTFCQDNNDTIKNNCKSFGLEVKIGNPNIIGLNAEYLFPKRKKMFIGVDLTILPNFVQSGNTSASLYYAGINFGYYFFKPCKGLYVGTGYVNNHESNLTYAGRVNGISNYGYSISTIKFTSGYKLIFGRFLLRPEIGIGINSWQKKMTIVKKYPDGFERTTEAELTNLINNKIEVIGTISIGITF